MNRKDRRKEAKLAKKLGNEDLEKKLSLAADLAECCRACHKDFDKNNMSMLDSWIVVVRESLGESHLYCPECWELAQSMIHDLQSSD